MLEKAEQEFNIVPADSEEGKVITEKLIGKPKASVTELVTAEKIILDMKNMDPMDAMKEVNKVLKREGKYKNLKEEDVERIMEDTNDFIFGRDIPEDPEGFCKRWKSWNGRWRYY
jgi:tricorn protease-like protein